MSAGSSTVALPGAWRRAFTRARRHRAGRTVLGGSAIMLAGSVLVSALNFLFNVTLARLLGPAEFGHVAVAVTLFMLASAITLSFQLVCAKFVARNASEGAKSAIYAQLRRRAWWVGAAVSAALVAGSGFIASYLRLPTPWIVILLAAGIAVYVPLGVKRGGLQGVCSFPRLAGSFVLENAVKYALAVVLVVLGYGVLGAVGAISVAVVAAYLLVSTGGRLQAAPEAAEPASFREGVQAIAFFVGQVVINNIDILLVKHFFAPEQAGIYAAVALVGRVLYFGSWMVISAMFPVSAGAQAEPEDRRGVLAVPLLLVTAMSAALVLALALFPGLVVRALFGAEFAEARPLLSLYAAATGLYALSVTLIAYEMSRRIANTAWVQLAFSALVVAAIYLFHDSLRQVVLVQLALMAAMLAVVAAPFLRPRAAAPIQEAA